MSIPHPRRPEPPPPTEQDFTRLIYPTKLGGWQIWVGLKYALSDMHTNKFSVTFCLQWVSGWSMIDSSLRNLFHVLPIFEGDWYSISVVVVFLRGVFEHNFWSTNREGGCVLFSRCLVSFWCPVKHIDTFMISNSLEIPEDVYAEAFELSFWQTWIMRAVLCFFDSGVSYGQHY